MSFDDRQRLDEDQRQPRITQLHLALTRLRSCVTFMHSGAHPDDEMSSMLAALSYRDGFDISYACANRGEGGQNDIGTESSAALGTVRTAEMEAAARVLDLRLYWLSTHKDDSVFDFGFSKSGEETLRNWNRQRTLERFVSIVRREQPDILCPTFLDVPGQHGHHRAMTLLAHEVMDCSADPMFVIDEKIELCDQMSDSEAEHRQLMANTPWQISKLYLPAFGGGGSAYDDEEPPPSTTLRVSATGRDPITGWSWENLGQQSRRYHLTQGMGRWVMHDDEREWPLHLAKSYLGGNGNDDTLHDGLAYDFQQWAMRIDDAQLSAALCRVHDALNDTINGFPDFSDVTNSGFTAYAAIDSALTLCVPPQHLTLKQRLIRKQTQLSRVITLASGATSIAWCEKTFWHPGDRNKIIIDTTPPEQVNVQCDVKLVASRVEQHVTYWSIQDNELVLDRTAKPDNPYPDTWFPGKPEGPVLQFTLTRDEISVEHYQALETPAVVLSAASAVVQPDAVLVNLARPIEAFKVQINRCYPDQATANLNVPDGWAISRSDNEIMLSPPSVLPTGMYELPVELDQQTTMLETRVQFPHIKPRVFNSPAKLRVRAVSIELPNVRIGYIGGGNDRVAFWLRAMGFIVHEFNDEQLGDAVALKGALASVDTLVIGVFAYRMRANLTSLASTINGWVNDGGHLLTLYHRPWDNWNPEIIPPARLEIGQPSLRYRITDENAAVNYLTPNHPALNTPNIIDAPDWQGWHKERGLYFAKSWDPSYTPLLSMSDPEEAAHEGALLVAHIGKGQHIHTSLILHHQMEHLVPGAFRLMANLVR